MSKQELSDKELDKVSGGIKLDKEKPIEIKKVNTNGTVQSDKSLFFDPVINPQTKGIEKNTDKPIETLIDQD